MKAPGLLFSGPLPCGLRASDCGSPSGCPRPRCCAPFLAARSPAYGGQALRYACAWLRASWHSAISGASRPSDSLGCGLRVCGTACAVSSTLGAAHPFSGPLPCGLRASDCGSPSGCPRPRCCAPFLAARSPAYGGQALRYACAWLRASWLSAISGASRPSASLGRGLRVCGTAARCPQPSVLRTL